MSFFSNNSITEEEEHQIYISICLSLFFFHSFFFFNQKKFTPPNRDRNHLHCGNLQEETKLFWFLYYKKWCIFISNMHIAYKYCITNEVVAWTLKNVDFSRSKVDVFLKALWYEKKKGWRGVWNTWQQYYILIYQAQTTLSYTSLRKYLHIFATWLISFSTI